MTAHLSPTAEQMALLAGYPDETPFVMVNLLRFKGKAGEERYWQEYAPRVSEILREAGGTEVFEGSTEHLIIGTPTEHWDAVWLVRWPSKAAFFRMANHPDFAATQAIRVSSLDSIALLLTSERAIPNVLGPVSGKQA
jgi:uncharacterized protein (DUF1330 family)